MATIDITKLSPKIMDYQNAEACLLLMGWTSDTVAAAYHISRERQDQMAADSHLKALVEEWLVQGGDRPGVKVGG